MDDSQDLYAPDSTTRLIEQLKPAFGKFTFYEAWPNVWPPDDAWPVMIVQLLNSRPTIGPTETDEVPETIEITVMLNQADAAGSTNVRTTTRRHLQNIIQGQDPSAINEYRPDTVMYALRKYLTLENWLINSDVNIKYDIVPPPELPAMVAATITLTTWRRVIVQDRS